MEKYKLKRIFSNFPNSKIFYIQCRLRTKQCDFKNKQYKLRDVIMEIDLTDLRNQPALYTKEHFYWNIKILLLIIKLTQCTVFTSKKCNFQKSRGVFLKIPPWILKSPPGFLRNPKIQGGIFKNPGVYFLKIPSWIFTNKK